MKNIFFASDTHFSHKNIIKFLNRDGSKLRPWNTIEEHDEALVNNWNRVVGPYDHVYHLGDVAMDKKGLQVVKRLNGKLRLIPGNHDVYKTRDYLSVGFEEIKGVRVFDNMICSHIPLAEESITERFGTNVHGHLHGNVIPNPRYFSVSMEQIEFTPIHYDELLVRIKANYVKYNKEFPVYKRSAGATPG